MSHSLDVESINVDNKIIPSLNPQKQGQIPDWGGLAALETSKGQTANGGYSLDNRTQPGLAGETSSS